MRVKRKLRISSLSSKAFQYRHHSSWIIFKGMEKDANNSRKERRRE